MRNTTILQLIQKHVEKTPYNIAICSAASEINYQELNTKSDHLATLLLNFGIKQQSIIGIYLKQDKINIIISILAILKIGATYVPLDTDFSTERLNHCVKDINLIAIITETALKEFLPSMTTRKYICLDQFDLGSITIDTSISKLTQAIKPKQLAYIIYTSGSTGSPKVVGVSHANILNAYFGWKKIYHLKTNYIPITPQDANKGECKI